LPASPALPPLTPADHAAFEAELIQLNLRNILWFAIAGNIFVWGVTLLLILHPIPLSAESHFFDGVLCAMGLTTVALILWLRRRSVPPLWPRVIILANAALYLGLTSGYFFAMIPAYGNTSVYIVGVLSLVIFFRLPPVVLVSLLLLNHAIFLFLLFQQPMPHTIVVSAAVDYSGMVVLAGVAGWLLYRAQWENFRKERVIVERNRELARLHQLELTEKIAAQLAEEKARLEVLRYQLNPHFLFNALTSVCSQLPPTLTGARATIERLTDFCQLTLFKPEDGEHPTLEGELNLLRAYLDIEKSRWGDLLTIEIEIAPAVVTERIPSLLLLPLLENALKYGRATNRGAMTVRVTAHRDASSALVIAIANTGEWVSAPGTASVPSLGIGLENLRQRLQRYYPGAHEFATEAKDGWVVARLAIHASEQPATNGHHA
jgi:signal transduction histidine kinase